MKFNDKYLGAVFDIETEDNLHKTKRLYPCDTGMGGCGVVTGWRDFKWGLPIPCCSEECREIMTKNCTDTLGIDPELPAACCTAAAEPIEEVAFVGASCPVDDGTDPGLIHEDPA